MIMIILVLLLFIRRTVSLSLLPSHDSFPSSSSSTSLSLSSSYQYARNVRIQYGHEVAQPLYYNLLVNTNTKNHNTTTNNTKNTHTNRIIDYTVSSRIAGASFVKNGGVLHTMKYACCYHHHHHHRDGDGCSDSDDDDDDDDDDTIIRNIYQTKIRQLNLFLQSIRYNTKTIHQFIFDTTNNSASNSCSSYSSCSPSYLQPAIAGSVTQLPFSFGVSSSSSLSVSTTTPARPKQQQQQPTSTTIDSNSSSSSSVVVVVNEEDDASTFALQIFISLYLLGIAIPIDTCKQYISDDIIQLLYDLHLLCPCDIDRSLLIPTVMITPIDIPPMISIPNNKTTTTTITSNNNSTSSTPSNSNSNTSTTASTSKSTATTAWFVTDWHPRVLNTIKIIDPTSTTNPNTTSTTNDTMNDDGRENEDDDDEAVMYVGPDTLAMIQHWIFFFRYTATATTSNNNMNTNTVLLDFCTGCGVQAIMNLVMYQQQQQSKLNYDCTIHTTNTNNTTTTTAAAAAVCIDKNHRALRFTYFNTLLNNICDDNIILVHGDILQKTGHIVFWKNNNTNINNNNNNNHFIRNLFAVDKTSSKATTSTTTITKKPIVSSLLPLLQGIVATLKSKKKNDTTIGKTTTSGTTSSSNKYYYDEITANPPFLPVPTTADTKQNSLSSSSSSFIISCDDDNYNKNDNDTCNDYGTNDYDKTIQQMIQRRYGLFSASGNTGEEVLATILELSRTLLKQNGFVSIVSEFFFRYNNDSSRNIDNNPDTIQLFDNKNNMIMNNTNIFIMKEATNGLLERLYSYYSGELDSSMTIATSSNTTKNSKSNNSNIDNWRRRRSVVSRIRTSNSCGLLFTNQYPISSSLYAERRADNYAEYQLWLRHLQKQHIVACSPGLLYIQKEEDEEQRQSSSPSSTKTTKQSSLLWENILVPKTDQGSVWTPTNQKAVAFTQSTSRAFFQQQQQQKQQ